MNRNRSSVRQGLENTSCECELVNNVNNVQTVQCSVQSWKCRMLTLESSCVIFCFELGRRWTIERDLRGIVKSEWITHGPWL